MLGTNSPLRPAEFSSPGGIITVIPEGTGNDLDALAKAAVLIIKFRPEELLPPTVMNWTVDGIVAYSKICTHVGCPAALYEHTTHHILCPCHQSTFDAQRGAKVIFGPAPRPLPQLPITVNADGLPRRAERFPRAGRPELLGARMSNADKALRGVGGYLDDRFRGAKSVRNLLKKIFPDHWSFLLGEIALYSFIILLLTGTFLTLFFKPSMTDVIYHGSYTKLNGVHMSEAYASTLNISFDVRGGLLMRQIHHWAAILFLAAIMAHMLRIFFTGAFRKPREINWLIGVTLLALGIVEGFAGYSLPDDLLSGTGLRILEGVLLSIPIVGTYIIVLRLRWAVPRARPDPPALHRARPAAARNHPGAGERAPVLHVPPEAHPDAGQGAHGPERGRRADVPVFHGEDRSLLLLRLRGVRRTLHVRPDQPDLAVRPLQPGSDLGGFAARLLHGLAGGRAADDAGLADQLPGPQPRLSVFIAGLLVLGVLITGLALYPFLEQWVTGDKREHHVLDRPRDAPTRTAIGVGGVTFYGLLWLIGGNDLIARCFDIQLYWITWIGRVSMIVGPIIAYFVAKRICLGLQRKDRELLVHGVETGIIVMQPQGEFVEVTRPVSEEVRCVLTSRKELPELASAQGRTRMACRRRGRMGSWAGSADRLHHVFAEDIPLADGDGNGHHELPAGDGEQPTLTTTSEQDESEPTSRT